MHDGRHLILTGMDVPPKDRPEIYSSVTRQETAPTVEAAPVYHYSAVDKKPDEKQLDTTSQHTTDESIKELAVALKEGRIFTDRHIRKEDAKNMLGMVFLPIALGALAEMSKEDADNIGMIYEYLSEAGPRSCNGYPSFFSMKILSQSDTVKVFDLYKKLVAAEKAALETK